MNEHARKSATISYPTSALFNKSLGQHILRMTYNLPWVIKTQKPSIDLTCVAVVKH